MVTRRSEPDIEGNGHGTKKPTRGTRKHPKRESVETCAKRLIKEFGPFRYDGKEKQWWRYGPEGHYWRPIHEAWFLRPSFKVQSPPGNDRAAKHIVQTIGHLCGPPLGSDSFEWRGISWFENEEQTILAINAANGTVIVDLEAEEVTLRESSPEDGSNAALPVAYDPEAQCPVFDRVEGSCLPDPEDRDLLEFYTAYCLWPDFRFQVVLYCQGPPNSGKSLLMLHGIGKGLFGEENISRVTLEKICNSGDELRKVRHATINFGNEIKGADLKDADIFIRLADGDAFDIAFKYEKAATLRHRCKCAFIGNPLPQWAHGNEGSVRRIRLLHFGENFGDQPKDAKLEVSIEREGSGILNKILDRIPGMTKLPEMPFGGIRSRGFHDVFVIRNAPVESFVKRFSIIGEELRIDRDRLIEAFVKWCEREDIMSSFAARGLQFTRILRQFHPEIRVVDSWSSDEKVLRKRAKILYRIDLNEEGKRLF